MSAMLMTTACTALIASTALGFDVTETEQLRLESINVMRIVYSPSLQTSTVTVTRGACPQEQATHTDSDFGAGQYTLQAGFAQSEAAGASWTLQPDRFPLKFDSAEILFATSATTQSTTTEWGVEVWEGTPSNGTKLASFQSDDLILPHLNMPPGTSGTIIQFMIDPGDPEQIYINDNGTHAYTVAFRVIRHNSPGSPCLTAPPTNANAFPTTDIGGLDSPTGNWIDMVTGPWCVCGDGWNTFQQIPSICTPSGDWVLRSHYTPYGCAPGSGACCLGDGSCEINSEDACLISGGSYEGDDTDCDSTSCPQPMGACCLESSGNCVDSEAEVCAVFGGVWHYGENCNDWVCFPEGACCLADGSCLDTQTPESCLFEGGTFQGDGSTCDVVDCPAPTSWCCTNAGSDCFVLEEGDCSLFGGEWGPPGGMCDDADACDDASSCPADIDSSGFVGVDDVLAVLSGWGNVGPNQADVNGDGIVDVNDVLMVISAWGPCVE